MLELISGPSSFEAKIDSMKFELEQKMEEELAVFSQKRAKVGANVQKRGEINKKEKGILAAFHDDITALESRADATKGAAAAFKSSRKTIDANKTRTKSAWNNMHQGINAGSGKSPEQMKATFAITSSRALAAAAQSADVSAVGQKAAPAVKVAIASPPIIAAKQVSAVIATPTTVKLAAAAPVTTKPAASEVGSEDWFNSLNYCEA